MLLHKPRLQRTVLLTSPRLPRPARLRLPYSPWLHTPLKVTSLELQQLLLLRNKVCKVNCLCWGISKLLVHECDLSFLALSNLFSLHCSHEWLFCSVLQMLEFLSLQIALWWMAETRFWTLHCLSSHFLRLDYFCVSDFGDFTSFSGAAAPAPAAPAPAANAGGANAGFADFSGFQGAPAPAAAPMSQPAPAAAQQNKPLSAVDLMSGQPSLMQPQVRSLLFFDLIIINALPIYWEVLGSRYHPEFHIKRLLAASHCSLSC